MKHELRPFKVFTSPHASLEDNTMPNTTGINSSDMGAAERKKKKTAFN